MMYVKPCRKLGIEQLKHDGGDPSGPTNLLEPKHCLNQVSNSGLS